MIARIGYIERPESGRVIVDYSGNGRSTVSVRAHAVPMKDKRVEAAAMGLDSHGVLLTTHRHPMVKMIAADPGFDSEALSAASADYHAGIMPLVKSATGARDIVPLRNGLIMRRQRMIAGDPADWKNHQTVRTASPNAHIDITAQSARNYVWIAMAWEGIQEIAPYSRLAIVQSWHVLTPPPQDYPLAFCDPATVSPDDLFHIDYFPPAGRVDIMAESHAVQYNPAHRWFYFSGMTPEEIILFKGYDSDAAHSVVPPHTAFRAADVADAHSPRASIEARYLVFFD
jgi:hypothetical protein